MSFVQSSPCPAVTDGDFWSHWLRDKHFFLRMCARWLRCSPHDAEDVLSRGALKALTFLRNHPHEVERFRPWTLRMLHNLCIDSLRARGREGVVIVADDDGAGERRTPAHTPPPDRALLSSELGTALAAAVAALPPRLQSTFRMRCIDDLPYDEIARRLAISQDNARKRVQQARCLLRERLVEYAT